MLSLDWAAVRDGVPSCVSCQVRAACTEPFFECQEHWHQKLAKVGQRVHVKTYRRPWLSAFWSAFSFARNNCKSAGRTRNAWRLVCDSSQAVRMDAWSQSAIGNVAGEFYDKGIEKMPQRCVGGSRAGTSPYLVYLFLSTVAYWFVYVVSPDGGYVSSRGYLGGWHIELSGTRACVFILKRSLSSFVWTW